MKRAGLVRRSSPQADTDYRTDPRATPAVGGRLTIVPVTLRVAAAFITGHHRHLSPPRGHRFSIGLATGDRPLIGLVAVGRPDPHGQKPSSTRAESGYSPAPPRRPAPQLTARSAQPADRIPLMRPPRRLPAVPKETSRCLAEHPTGDHPAYATDCAGLRRPR
jgi:hypothetical protein